MRLPSAAWHLGGWLPLLSLLACTPAERGTTAPQGSPAARSAKGPGPAVGEAFPSFEAPDQTGRVWTFESLRGPKGLVLNVNRSVVW
jgi:hypothetical protein